MLSNPDIVALLQKNQAFEAVPTPVLEELAEKMEQKPVEAEQILIEKGVRCGSVFVAVEGEFGVYVNDPVNPVARLGIGRIFGEIGAVSGIEATATVKALTDGLVLEIPGPQLHQAIWRAPELAESLLRSLARYLGSE